VSDVFLSKGSMDARYEHQDLEGANTRIHGGTTEQMLCEETGNMHTVKVAMIDGMATLVCDQEGMN
jgi:hypothetical protein